MKIVLCLLSLVALGACSNDIRTGVIVRKHAVPIQNIFIYSIDVANGKDTLKDIRVPRVEYDSCRVGDTLNLTD